MDPVAAANVIQATQASEPALTALLVSLAIGLMEIIKLLINWMGKKFSKKDKPHTLLVQLDPEVSAIVHETGDNVKGVNAIVSRVDADGMPLVYADRKMERTVEKIALILERISSTQERLAENMAKLEERFDRHSSEDAVTFARMTDAQDRIEGISSLNRDSLLEFRQDHRHAMAVLQEIKSKIDK